MPSENQTLAHKTLDHWLKPCSRGVKQLKVLKSKVKDISSKFKHSYLTSNEARMAYVLHQCFQRGRVQPKLFVRHTFSELQGLVWLALSSSPRTTEIERARAPGKGTAAGPH